MKHKGMEIKWEWDYLRKVISTGIPVMHKVSVIKMKTAGDPHCHRYSNPLSPFPFPSVLLPLTRTMAELMKTDPKFNVFYFMKFPAL